MYALSHTSHLAASFNNGFNYFSVNSLHFVPSHTEIPHNLRNNNVNSFNDDTSRAIERFDMAPPYLSHYKDHKWYQMFHNKDIEEEQLMLLPTKMKENYNNQFKAENEAKYASVYTASLQKNGGKSTEIQIDNFNIENTKIQSSPNHEWWLRYISSEVLNHSRLCC